MDRGDAARPGPRRVEHIMGMPIGVDIRDPDVDPAALDRVFAWLRWVDATFSTYRSDSEISRLNRGALSPGGLHPEVRTILERCEQLRFATGGYFDIRGLPLPPGGEGDAAPQRATMLDPSGLVKGWSVDRAGTILEAAGAHNYCINAGGDVLVHGRPTPESQWRIGIQHPYVRDRVAAVVRANDLAIATSGAYERGHHIVDPHSGRPPDDVLSVTIVGPELATADAYATAAYAMGREGPAWTTGLNGFEAMTILADETVLFTPGFPSV